MYIQVYVHHELITTMINCYFDRKAAANAAYDTLGEIMTLSPWYGDPYYGDLPDLPVGFYPFNDYCYKCPFISEYMHETYDISVLTVGLRNDIIFKFDNEDDYIKFRIMVMA